MDNIRAAAYLHTRIRLDAKRKTSSTIKCKPPNKVCGRRCIPPSWDCRLKGEGHDTHQRATGFDPLSGAANIQRGVKRVAKGVVTGNVSEVEGGTRAIKRGIVKATPGDIEKKKKVRETLDKNTRNITIGLALVTGGFALHNVMKRGWPAYANGPGRQLDDSVRAGVSAVMDRVPGVGGIRAEQRRAAEGAALATSYRINVTQQSGPDALTQQAAEVPGTIRNGGYGNASRQKVGQALNDAEREAQAGGYPEDEWKRVSREKMWSATVAGRSVFADDATYQFLAQQHGLAGQRTGILRDDIKFLEQRIAGSLSLQSRALRQDAVNQGFAISANGRGQGGKRAQAKAQYLDQIINRDFAGAPVQFQNSLRTQLKTLLDAPDGHDFSSEARAVYRDTLNQFDAHFKSIADFAAVPSGDRVRPEQRNLVEHMNIGHAQALHTRMQGNLRDIQIAGPSHAEFTQKYVFDTKVNGRPTSSPSNRVIVSAASEMSGQAYTNVNAARDYLIGQGYSKLSRVTPAEAPTPPPAPTPGSRPRRNRRVQRSYNDIVAMLTRGGLSPEAAQTEARRIIERRGDADDETFNVYMATYLAQLQRLDAGKGKPCGESYIPKAHKCGKQSVAASAKRTEVLSDKHDAKYRARMLGSLIARVGLTAGAGILAYKAAEDMLENGHKYSSDQMKGAFYTTIGLSAIAAVGVGSILREQKVTKNSKQLTAEIEKLKAAKGVEPETIDKVNKFITETDMDVQRVGAMYVLMGMGGYFTTDQPNRVHTIGGSPTHDRTYNSKDPIDALDNGLNRYMQDRAKLSPRQQDARNIKDLDTMKRNFSVAGYVGNSKAASTAITLHEIGHAIHYRGDFATPVSVTVKGKKYEGDELQAELMRSSSIYGQSDIRKAARPAAGDYYSQGNRLETFTENFVLYAANGKNMKEQFPVSYAWTKATVDYSLSKPAAKPARPMADVIEELAAGAERFDPKKTQRKPKTVAKTDSEDASQFFALYEEMREAATSGDLLQAIATMAKAQALPREQRFMIASLMETAAMYRTMPQ